MKKSRENAFAPSIVAVFDLCAAAVMAHGDPVFFLEQLRRPANIVETAFEYDLCDGIVAVFKHIGYIVQP